MNLEDTAYIYDGQIRICAHVTDGYATYDGRLSADDARQLGYRLIQLADQLTERKESYENDRTQDVRDYPAQSRTGRM